MNPSVAGMKLHLPTILTPRYSEPTIVLNDIRWQTYVSLLTDLHSGHSRLTYNCGELEISAPSFGRENASEWIGTLIQTIAFESGQTIRSGGSTTLRSSKRRIGVDPDKSFWLTNARAMRGKSNWTVADPPPDLVVEIEIAGGMINRLEILAALHVPEIWRYDGRAFEVLELGRDNKYRHASKSRVFPSLPVQEIERFIRDLPTKDETRLLIAFRSWLQEASLQPR